MRKSAIRIVCACLLMGVALAAVGGTIGAVFAEQTPQAPAQEVQEPAPIAVFSRVRLTSAKPHERIALYGTDGKLLQAMQTDADACAVTKLLVSGAYYVCTENAFTAFTLEEDAAITVDGGCGWSDGEKLHLEQGTVGTLTLELQADAAAAELGWLDYVLTDGTYRRRQVVYCEKVGQALTCVFEGVPYGEYRLEESGNRLATVSLNAETPNVTLCLP